ncbi:hypothetical protein [uncultured Anaerococcus sp.]|uniref:hypothetical protein n=1 Tax=uncultured Anaerococcus sp. TaxID=293428 RepID=UPI00261E2237|nr:hypothetical protein [uncultured Anaerococcus sp.]
MKLNKTLIAALVLGIGLTGCDNMVDNGNGEKNNDDNTPVVEENQDETKNTADTENEETKSDKNEETAKDDNEEKVETEADENDTDKESTEDTTEESDKKEDSMTEEKSTGSQSKEEQIETLEQAIFDNRSAARAVELIFELSPEAAAKHEDELNALLDDSNELLEKAQTALDQIKEQ